MIESLMLVALGFFVATLFAAIAAQFVWRRAVTVTKRSLLEMDAASTEEARAAELDALMQRQRKETAPLEQEIRHLRAERDALHSSNEELARDNASLANEINTLRNETSRLQAEVAALGSHADRAAADAAERMAAVKHEISALETVIAGIAAPISPLASYIVEEPGETHAGEAGEAEIAMDAADAERTLSEVKASLARLDAMTGDDRTAAEHADERLTEAHIGDKALLARIKALEAGVAN
jgi:chromosome segregation ATPase